MALNRTVMTYLALLFCGIIFSLVLKTDFRGNTHQYIPMPYNSHLRLDVVNRARQGHNLRNDREVLMHPQNETCQRRLPKAIIIGTAKSGTLALITFLSFHPQIAATLQPGEVRFFINYYKKGLEWYRSKMKCSYSNQISIEKTPGYFYSPKCGLKIKAMDENIKLIIIVKDPITRTQSHYAMRVKGSSKYPSFKDMLTDPRNGKLKTENILLKWSDYTYYLKQWLKIFSLNQIHVVDGLVLEKNPASELRKVENFLGIGNYFTEEKFVLNKTKGKFCVRSESGMECLGSNKGRAHPDIPANMLVKMKKHFHPINTEFFKLIGRRFNWGY